MIRVALYARFSTDEQNDKSNDDQLRDLRRYVARQPDWSIRFEDEDAAASGATRHQRPGLGRVLQMIEAREVDVLLTESPSRASRAAADMHGIWDELQFARVRWITLSHGEMDDMKVTFAAYECESKLKAVSQETTRGLLSCIEKGRSCGGVPYGYDLDRSQKVRDKWGKLVVQRGVLKPNPEKLAHVLRAMQLVAEAGYSPDRLTRLFNDEGILGPRGGRWLPTTFRGDAIKRNGILRNPIYVGKLIGGRFSWRLNRKKGKRQSRLNPESEWRITDVPHLRVPGLTDELFAQVQAKLAASGTKAKAAGAARRNARGIVRARMPIFALSGLTKCAVCGGGFTVAYRGALRCNNYMKAGRAVCTNDRSILYTEVERRVLVAVEKRLLTKEYFDEITAVYTTEINRLRAEHRAKQAEAPRELAGIKTRTLDILNFRTQEGWLPEEWKHELRRLSDRQVELEATIATRGPEPPLPTFHPSFFKLKVKQLAAVLNATNVEERETARQAVRNLIDRIEIPPGDALLQVVGNLEGLLAAAEGRDGQRLPVKLVAGARLPLYRKLCWAAA